MLPEEISTRSEFGKLQDRCVYDVCQLTKANKLPHKRLGGRVVYSIAALKKFINEPDTQQ